MPGLAYDCQFTCGDTTTSYSLSSNTSVSSSGFWSKHRDDVSYNQLQKFWSDLSPQARQKLLRVDKQTLFEQARKNMYCSRCNGLLLEGFLQIVMYGKSLQQDGIIVGQVSCNASKTSKTKTIENACLTNKCDDDLQDPSVHPWGGLTTTRDGTLTLLDCYLYSKSLKGLQNVFGSARARERERELLYPDACGGGGRGWISQGIVGYGRGHGTRETCALHTARLSVETLVDFWSALGEETRHSLLKMKEEDFMERLMYRFDSKRFCRDCRKNVIREFKELKEFKRMRREARCTSWFCVADTSFQYEVTEDTVQADWHHNYADSAGTYHHYEWAVGTAEGKSDIVEFENVGLKVKAKAKGLDLTGINACYITLRAWKKDGRCNEVSVKAHALNGQQCVHCRLVVGDGFVAITRGESIRRFFEQAEEAEEEEDDDSMDNDGNEVEGECSRPQKHAKSPELAREFLLDAATVIFKEQVEKAFREGTARQNAHSIFVSLALKLLEERVLVACKDIITLEKQFKLLEEEEKEKRDEEERKERRRVKEKDKKLRRKERLKNKEKERENNCQQNQVPTVCGPHEEEEEEPTSIENDSNSSDTIHSLSKPEEEDTDTASSVPISEVHIIQENDNSNYDVTKHPRRKPKLFWDQSPKWSERGRESGGMVNKPDPRNRPLRNNNVRVNVRSNGSRYGERLYCSHNRSNDRYDPHACSCYNQHDYTDVLKPYYVKKTWEPKDKIENEPVKVKPVDQSTIANSVATDYEHNDLKESKDKISRPTDLCTRSISNSDSCSSCLSESSNTQTPDSSSTSDSEDASISNHSEVIKDNILPQKKENKKETETQLPTKTPQFYENEKKNDVTGPIFNEYNNNNNNNVIPQGIHFPVFQPPSMGYFHQSPVPWANGLMPLPHPNHYLFPSPFGYGLNANPHFLQYGVGNLQPLGPPLVNHGQPPMYQPVPPVNDNVKVSGLQKVERKNEKLQNEDSEKTRKGNTGFSLFHFGGPVALSNGPVDVPTTIEGGHACAKDAAVEVEEYNLFAASNGIRFSF